MLKSAVPFRRAPRRDGQRRGSGAELARRRREHRKAYQERSERQQRRVFRCYLLAIVGSVVVGLILAAVL